MTGGDTTGFERTRTTETGRARALSGILAGCCLALAPAALLAGCAAPPDQSGVTASSPPPPRYPIQTFAGAPPPPVVVASAADQPSGEALRQNDPSAPADTPLCGRAAREANAQAAAIEAPVMEGGGACVQTACFDPLTDTYIGADGYRHVCQ